MVGRIRVSPRFLHHDSWSLWLLSLYSKRDFADMVGVLKMGGISDYTVGLSVITRFLVRSVGRVREL